MSVLRRLQVGVPLTLGTRPVRHLRDQRPTCDRVAGMASGSVLVNGLPGLSKTTAAVAAGVSRGPDRADPRAPGHAQDGRCNDVRERSW